MVTLQQLLDRKDKNVYAVGPDDPVIEAIRRMADNHVGALLVMEGEQLLGIISERDYARKVVLKARSSTNTPVRDIMTAPVVSISSDASVEDAMRRMTRGRFRHLPVVDGGKVTGVVSIGDLVKSVIDDQRHQIDDLQQYIHG